MSGPMACGLAVIVAFCVPDVARAQCAGGRTVEPATQGRCCWSGQHWDGARCAGPPTCPAGMGAAGDECVPTAGATPAFGAGGLSSGLTAPSAEQTATAAASIMPDAPPRGPTGLRHPRRGTHPDWEALGGGIVFLVVGYVAALVPSLASSLEQTCWVTPSGAWDCEPAATWPFALIPFLHQLAAIDATYRDGAMTMIGPIPGLTFELIGLLLALTGGLRSYPHLEGQAGVRFVPSAPGADAGASIEARF